jgi:hypothetical protein
MHNLFIVIHFKLLRDYVNNNILMVMQISLLQLFGVTSSPVAATITPSPKTDSQVLLPLVLE